MIFFLQHDVCRALEEQDGEKKFLIDKWQRKEVGGFHNYALSRENLSSGFLTGTNRIVQPQKMDRAVQFWI